MSEIPIIGAGMAAEAPEQTYEEELGIAPPGAEPTPTLPHETRGSSQSLDALAELREANCDTVKEQRWPGQAELGEEHEEERTGRILHAAHFLQMLRRSGLICVYTKCNAAQGLRSLHGAEVARERAAHFERTMAGLTVMGTVAVTLPRPVAATWVQIPWMYEYSVMRFDAHGVPTNEKFRGWRTVLLELIRGHHISEAECNRIFGRPRGPAAVRWNQIMQAIRTNAGIC